MVEILYLDIREVRPDDTIHNTPNVCNGVLVDHFDAQLISDKAPCAFSTEQVFGADSFCRFSVHMCEIDLNRIGRVLAIVLETGNCPWSLDVVASLLNVLDKHTLDQALVEQCGEGISGINEFRATRPSPRLDDSL